MYVYDYYPTFDQKIKNDINIIFLDDYGKKIIIRTHQDELLSSIFNKYLTSANNNKYDLNFQFGFEQLDPNKTLRDYNIATGSIINVKETNNVLGRGGFCFKFTDLSKKMYSECPLTETAPVYRYITKGINIYGICKSEKCIAHNQEVICPLEGIKRFDLIGERENLKCPSCRGLIEPKTVGFYLCNYKIKGKNFENGNVKSFEFYGKATNKKSLQYYDPIKNGDTLVIELIIEITNF